MSQPNSPNFDWSDLSAYNTLAIPARAKALYSAASVSQLQCAIEQANTHQWPFLILGEGSNTVFVGDYPGTVILNRLRGIRLLAETAEYVQVRAAAGENWHQFVQYCVDQGWSGLENLALIPGLVGASPIQNIGAYGVEVKDVIESVEAYDLDTEQVEHLSNQECEFGYRESRFKQQWANTKIVTAVVFKFSKLGKPVLDYPGLSQQLSETTQPTPKDVFNAVVRLRSEKLPDPADTPNAGSFFKNPVVDKQCYQRLQSEYPDLVAFAHGDMVKLAAAWLIDTAGWKRKQIDGVKVHEQQALVLINPNGRDGHAVTRFAQALQTDIQARFGVELEIEPRLINGALMKSTLTRNTD